MNRLARSSAVFSVETNTRRGMSETRVSRHGIASPVTAHWPWAASVGPHRNVTTLRIKAALCLGARRRLIWSDRRAARLRPHGKAFDPHGAASRAYSTRSTSSALHCSVVHAQPDNRGRCVAKTNQRPLGSRPRDPGPGDTVAVAGRFGVRTSGVREAPGEILCADVTVETTAEGPQDSNAESCVPVGGAW
jgi:hypothetical protein